MPSKDRIERVVVLPATREDVWDALTQPEQLANWFGPCEELDLHPGGTALFVGDNGEPVRAVVEVVEPPRRFAFRWRFPTDERQPRRQMQAATVVEFTLDEVADGTQLTLVESGFSTQAEPVHTTASVARGGWDEEIQGLVAYLGALGGVAHTPYDDVDCLEDGILILPTVNYRLQTVL